jgi:hypothetical protein
MYLLYTNVYMPIRMYNFSCINTHVFLYQPSKLMYVFSYKNALRHVYDYTTLFLYGF